MGLSCKVTPDPRGFALPIPWPSQPRQASASASSCSERADGALSPALLQVTRIVLSALCRARGCCVVAHEKASLSRLLPLGAVVFITPARSASSAAEGSVL